MNKSLKTEVEVGFGNERYERKRAEVGRGQGTSASRFPWTKIGKMSGYRGNSRSNDGSNYWSQKELAKLSGISGHRPAQPS